MEIETNEIVCEWIYLFFFFFSKLPIKMKSESNSDAFGYTKFYSFQTFFFSNLLIARETN